MAAVGEDSAEEITMRRRTPTVDGVGVICVAFGVATGDAGDEGQLSAIRVLFRTRVATGVLGVGTDRGDCGLLLGLTCSL